MKAKRIPYSLEYTRKIPAYNTKLYNIVDNPTKILVVTKANEIQEALKTVNQANKNLRYTQISPLNQAENGIHKGYLEGSEGLFIPYDKVEKFKKQAQNKDEFIPLSKLKTNFPTLEIDNMEQLKKILSFSNIKQIIKEYFNK